MLGVSGADGEVIGLEVVAASLTLIHPDPNPNLPNPSPSPNPNPNPNPNPHEAVAASLVREDNEPIHLKVLFGEANGGRVSQVCYP